MHRRIPLKRGGREGGREGREGREGGRGGREGGGREGGWWEKGAEGSGKKIKQKESRTVFSMLLRISLTLYIASFRFRIGMEEVSLVAEAAPRLSDVASSLSRTSSFFDPLSFQSFFPLAVRKFWSVVLVSLGRKI